MTTPVPPDPGIDLFCLPHAGGHAMLFRGWQAVMPPTVRLHAVDLPGHGADRVTSACSDWPELVSVLSGRCRTLRRPGAAIAWFGHSLGGLVALELAHAFRDAGEAPCWLGVSACPAPGRRAGDEGWLDADLARLVGRLHRLGGTDELLLNSHEFMEMVSSVLRADFHLCETHASFNHGTAPRRRPLCCPIDVLSGAADPSVTADDLAGWSAETLGSCARHAFPGGHFFLDGGPGDVTATIASSLVRARAGSDRFAEVAA